MSKYIPVLTIAGSDCSGGAGIQADIKAMSALGCYGMSAITAITAQNTTSVSAIQGISPEIVSAQIDMVYSDIRPHAVKTGMLFSTDIVAATADALERNNACNIVIDPVMVSTSGSLLISRDAIDTVVSRLFPLSSLITPNVSEAKELTGTSDQQRQAEILHSMGAKNVLLKGGDNGDSQFKTDYLYMDGQSEPIALKSPAVDTRNTHGTGCTLSSAIACFLAMGHGIAESVKLAKEYISLALEAGRDVAVGSGHGPVNHFFQPHKLIIK